MKVWVGAVLALVCMTLMQPASVSAIETIEPPDRLSPSPLLISAYYISGATPGYFEIYNSSSETIDMSTWALSLKWTLSPSAPTGSAASPPLTMPLASSARYLPGHHYAVVGFGSVVVGASVTFEAVTGTPNSFLNEISLVNAGYKPYVKTFTTAQSQRMMLGETTTGYTSTGSYATDTRTALYDSGLYTPSQSEFPLAPIEVLANPRNCSPSELDTACREYVKFYNHTSTPVSFEGTRLRIGYQGQAVSSSNTIALTGTIAPGEYAVFAATETGAPLTITNTGGYVWLEDLYGIVSYPSSVISYSDASSDTHKGQSWALINGSWQWALPSPSGANLPLPVETSTTTTDSLVPCRPDQYRSPETNRCRALESVSTPTACDSSEYRNPETGRCKKIASATSSTLQPCDDGQYRNPETNRCKSLASQASSLTPCAPGWERNPETNRCRKASAGTTSLSDFAVLPYEETKSSGLGWLAFATVGAGLAAYGIWEWRVELLNLRRKLFAKFVR